MIKVKISNTDHISQNIQDGRNAGLSPICSDSARTRPMRLRRTLMLALLTFASFGVKATDYVFVYNNGYLTVGNNGTITYTTTFSPQCVWTCVSNTSTLQSSDLQSTGNNNNQSNSNRRFLYTTDVNGTRRWLVGSTTDGTAISTQTSAPETAYWLNVNNRLIYRDGNNNYYAYYRGDSWRTTKTQGRNTSNNSYQAAYDRDIYAYPDYRSTTYTCTTTPQEPTDYTTTSISIGSISNNTITFTHDDLGGTFIPQYTRYVFNSDTHNWYNNTDYGSTVPSVNASTLNPTYTWSLTSNGGGMASINTSTGVLTLSGAPTGNITVRLTISNISPLGNKTAADFTLTRAAVSEKVTSSTELSNPTVSPTSTALYYQQYTDFTVSATATRTSSTIPAHTTLTGGGQTYYYYSGTLYASTDGFSTTASSPTNVTLTWSLSGDAANYLTRTPATGTSTTVTHSTQSPSDLTATLTVTATATDASNKTATATITAYGPIAEPTITHTGKRVSISTTTANASIYYTTDGSTTPSENSTPYTGPFDLTASPTTIKAIAIRDGHSSTVASETITIKLPTPVIQIGNTGLATIANVADYPTGTEIHYTIDNTNPTASSATYSSAVQLTNPQIIRAIAILSGYDNSDIGSGDFINPGVSGGNVILDDREDHSWAYYNKELDSPIRSWNPADVKITYFGNGTNTVNTTTNSTTPGDGTWNSSASSVKVSNNEAQNTFIYFKTLERSDGATANDPSGRCEYRAIPNPFTVRPTFSSGGTKYYTGFYKWRVKTLKGGAIYTAATGGSSIAVDGTIDGDQIVYFAPSSEYGMEVELEALWARAYVNSNTYVSGTNAYERNFKVGTTLSTNTNAVTFSTLNPDGTGDLGSITYNNNYTCSGDVKFENMTLSISGYINAAGKNLTIGRGVTNGNNNVATAIYGRLLDASSGSFTTTSFNVRIESGQFTNAYVFSNNQNYNYRTASEFTSNITFGSDYDRAKSADDKLKITGAVEMIRRIPCTSANAKINITTLSGTYGSNNADVELYVGTIQRSSGQQSALVKRTLEVLGGNFLGGVSGGIEYGVSAATDILTMRIHGGTIHQYLYGSGQYSAGCGGRKTVITGGTFDCWVAGGCYGTESSGGATDGNIYLYFGGKANQTNTGGIYGAGYGSSKTGDGYYTVNNSTVVVADEAQVAGNVYGGGNNGYVTGDATVYVAGSTVEGSVFGGANMARSGSSGTGNSVTVTMVDGLVKSGVYGGSNSSGTVNGSVTMHIDGGTVGDGGSGDGVFGGGYGSSTSVSGNVEVTVGANVGDAGAIINGDVYGGSALGSVNGTSANTNYHTYVTLNAGTINGSLYGGALGNDNTAANVYGKVKVEVNGGSVKKTDANGRNGSGAVYGCNNVKGAPQQSVEVIINGTDPAPSQDTYAIFAVYGGGNQADYAAGTPTVTVNNCDNSIEYVYGGGNAAHITNGNTNVTIYGGNKIGNVFGGGNGTVTAANVSGNTNVNIYGGTIGRVFGGSNSAGTIDGDLNVNIEKNSSCAIQVGSVYSGGNKADSKLGSITVGCMDDNVDMIDSLFCGANQANVTGSVNFKMTKGRIGNLFGGNNQSGNVSGTITVTVEWDNSCTTSYLGNVFGGGNLATFGTTGNTKAPTVNIYNGTVSGNVYGGGKGLDSDHSKGQITGNPKVTIGDTNNSHTATIEGDVYGGGDAGNVVGTPQVSVIDKANTTIGNVYGGGNAADVSGTDVKIQGGHITGDVFGGGHGDKQSLGEGHSDKAANVTGASSVQVTGGIIDRVFAGSNLNGTIGGNMTLSINKSDVATTPMKIGEVYGGANMADGRAASIDIGCTGTWTTSGDKNHTNANTTDNRIGYELEGIGYVYGGANQANIGTAQTASNITVGINSGIVANVFGGNNTSGTIYGTITVNIEKDNQSCSWYVGNVFGGGNLAAYTGSPAVNIKHGAVSGNVYGGGKGSSAVVTGEPLVTIGDTQTQAYQATVAGDVYGGGDAAAVTGNTHIVFGKANNSAAKLFGGGNAAGVSGTATVDLSAGSVSAGVYGGCNASGSVDGEINVNITGGSTVGAANSLANVHGGGYGAGTSTAGDVNVTINGANVNIYGDVYGGSGFGNVNDDINDATKVTLTAGKITGNIYGGGLGNAQNAALVNGTADVEINGGTVTGYIFGANNVNGTPLGAVTVTINGTDQPQNGYALGEVYGGGNMADYSPTVTTTPATVIVNGCDNSIEYVYGGGNAADVPSTSVTIYGGNIGTVFGGGHGDKDAEPETEANVSGDVTVNIYGGTIGKVFGGSNSKGTISGDVSVVVEKDGDCPMKIGEVYGGGNQADGNAGSVTIGCTGTWTTTGEKNHTNANNTDNRIGYELEGIGTVFGGANNANIGTSGSPSGIELTINSGMVANVFGGNNNGGTIYGDITVNIEQTSTTCGWYVGNVYGAGNLAPYSGTPTVNIKNGKVSINVYGGGKGSSAVVTGNPTVTIGDANQNYCAIVGRDVYGGGDAAAVTGNTTVIYNDANASSTVAKLFGGGNAANVSGTTTVTLTSGKVTGGVYGGCNASGSVGAVTIALNGGSVGSTGNGNAANVFGGGYGANTTTTNNITVTLGNTTVYGDIYGGSALGKVNSQGANPANMTTVTINGTNLHGNVFGGGQGNNDTQAVSYGDVTVNINGASAYSGIYGGANINGLVSGDILLNINANVGTSGNGNSRDVFGGGYGALTQTGGDVTVNVGNGTNAPTIYGAIYGGSALGSVNVNAQNNTTVNVLSGTINGNVYGGGLGQAGEANVAKGQVNGTVTVNIGATDGAQTPTYSGSATINGSVYGCNNTNGSPKANVFVNVYKTAHSGSNVAGYEGDNPTYSIDQVFGGGNQADYNPTSTSSRATVHIYTCDNTIRRVFGGGNAAEAYGVVTTIDGGRFDYIFGGGNGEDNAADIGAGGTNLTVNSGIINYLFGGSNEQGTILGNMGVTINNTGCTEDIKNFFAGGNLAVIGSAGNTVTLETNIACGTNFGAVYGGSNLADIYGNTILNINGGTMNEVYAGSKGRAAAQGVEAKAANIYGTTTLNIYAGAIGSAYGGSNINGNITGAITVNLEWDDQNDCAQKSITNVFGASNLATYTPTTPGNYPAVNIKNGTVSGSVFGAGNGLAGDPDKGVVTSNPIVTIGDSNGSHTAIVEGNVYGGGNNAAVSGNTSVTYNDNNNSSTVAKLFGGGNAANVSGTTSVTLTNGKVTGGIYGGCNTQGTVGGDAEVSLTGGTVGTDATHTANVHGGGFGEGTNVAGDVTVTLGTTSQTTGGPVIWGDVYGGSALGNTNTDTDNDTKLNLYIGTIHGSVYGGGLGEKDGFYGGTSNIESVVWGNVSIDLNGYMNGNTATQTPTGVYITGEVFGCNNLNGTPKGDVVVHVYKTVKRDAQGAIVAKPQQKNGSSYELAAVYGGGNLASYDPSTPNSRKAQVIIDGCDYSSIGYVYGGGNAASVPATEVTVNGSFEIGYLFGGGNGFGYLSGTATPNSTPNPGANVGYYTYQFDNETGLPEDAENDPAVSYGTGKAQVNLFGGTIHHVFGGSNTKGNVRDASVAFLDEADETTCPLEIDEIYGGGNEAYMEGEAKIELGCISHMAEIYGGAKHANIANSVELTITSGKFDRVFGGNNLGGSIAGTITVNVEETGCHPVVIGQLYGGGNQAAYTAPNGQHGPTINAKSFTSIGEIFGGGYGASAVVTGDTYVNINEVIVTTTDLPGYHDHSKAEFPLTAGDNVFTYTEGEGVNQTTVTVTAPARAANDSGSMGVIGSVFGGGNEAKVIGETYVNIGTASTVEMESILYDDDNDSETPKVKKVLNVQGANVVNNIYGGGNQAEVTGSTHVQIGPTPAP